MMTVTIMDNPANLGRGEGDNGCISPLQPPQTGGITFKDEYRFWSKVLVVGECWEWQAGLHEKGYGLFYFHGKIVRAHQFSWLYFYGQIQPGLQPDHLCRNRGCVNPAHLEAVTSKLNTLRGEGPTAINAKKTHCINGHALTGLNLIETRTSGRQCRECHNIRSRELYWRQRNHETQIQKTTTRPRSLCLS